MEISPQVAIIPPISKKYKICQESGIISILNGTSICLTEFQIWFSCFLFY